LGWVAENAPRYGAAAVDRIQSWQSQSQVQDPSTGTQMRRDPYGVLKKVGSFFTAEKNIEDSSTGATMQRDPYGASKETKFHNAATDLKDSSTGAIMRPGGFKDPSTGAVMPRRDQ